ncbi:MAG: Mur ligase family protein [Verrucomicrobiota bacterium JB024]|nr:Mur ligase family protein [Verrucomicrobiota bacterium JB024]
MPEKLAECTGGFWAGERTPSRVSGFTQDSRRAGPGDMFVALETSARDGHDFIPAAREAGAGSALVRNEVEEELPQLVVPDTLEAFQKIAAIHRRDFAGRVIGVTGSCGKTSTKDLLGLLLGERTLRTEGNLNNFLGVPLTLTRLDAAQHDFAVIEAGINEPGEMATLAAMIEPDIAVITCVAPAHLERLGTVEGVAREKALLGRRAGRVIFPGNCWQYAPFRDLGARALVVTDDETLARTLPNEQCVVSRMGNVDVGCCRLELESAALPAFACELPFSSPGMVSNAALALSAALLCGVSPDTLRSRLSQWRASRHRGEWLRLGAQNFFVDSYNANPASMAEAMSAFVASAPAELPRLYVLGGMKELGVETYRYHMLTGEKLKLRPQDRAVLIGSEADGYRDGLLKARNERSQLTLFTETQQAQAAVAAFKGAIMLKGSRAYALESLLPVDAKGGADRC